MTAMHRILQEDRRLVILRSLNEMAGYEANESIINQCLEQYAHNVSRDVVRSELAWLEEQQLVAAAASWLRSLKSLFHVRCLILPYRQR